MNNPLVSILIPVYNTEKYVAEAIESALNQTYKNIEIIIVDDGSTDKSWEIIENYRKKYPSIIKTYRQENKGACSARNKAFELSSGQYIQYLDADDLLAEDKIEHQIKYFDGSGNDDFVVNGRWRHFFGDFNEEIPWGPAKEIQKDLLPIDWLLEDKMSVPATWLFPRNLIKKSGGWNENLYLNQDGEFLYRLFTIVSEIKYCERSKIYYRKTNENSITNFSKFNRIKMESLFNSLIVLEKSLLKIENSARVKEFISKKYLEFYYRFYPAEKRLTKNALTKSNFYFKTEIRFSNNFLELVRKVLGFKVALWLRFIFKRKNYEIET